MDTITPSTIRYIKLGSGGRWEAALDRGRIEWGELGDAHVADLGGDWAAVASAYREQGHKAATATGYTTEARTFYNADPETLWITFARGRMWWALADSETHATGSDGRTAGAYYRTARGGWNDRDVTGAVLGMDRLSTRLTQLAGYRRTICGLSSDQQALCLRYINAASDPVQDAMDTARADFKRHLTMLIQRLTWRDFEQFVDLALARTGWVRISDLGGTTKDVDLLVEQAFTRERMAVQVKSAATQQVVNDYAQRLDLRSEAERIMLVCHSPVGELKAPPATGGRRLELVLEDAVADLSINAGLVDWVIARAI